MMKRLTIFALVFVCLMNAGCTATTDSSTTSKPEKRYFTEVVINDGVQTLVVFCEAGDDLYYRVASSTADAYQDSEISGINDFPVKWTKISCEEE